MAELDLNTNSEVIDYVKNEILTKLPVDILELNYANMEIFRSKVQVLRCYCVVKDLNPEIINRFDNILVISQGLWSFLRENTATLESMRAARRTLWSDLGANLLGIQALLSGQIGKDALNDLIMTMLSVILGIRGDAIWVDVAKDDLEVISKTYIIGLRDELWRFICETIQNENEMTLEKIIGIGEKMDALLNFIGSDNIPVAVRFIFIPQIYVLLLRLSIDKILIFLNEQAISPDN